MALKKTARNPRCAARAVKKPARCALKPVTPPQPAEINLAQSLAVRPLVLGPADRIHLCLVGLGGTGSVRRATA